MIRFSDVIAEGIDAPIDLFLSEGEFGTVITSREVENEAIVRLMMGFQPTLQGVFTLNGVQPCLLNDSEISLYRKKIGVIYQDGGFISNLNLWENLTLQLAYEGSIGRKEIETLGRAALKKVGYDGDLSLSASRLSLFKRRQIAFARVLLSEPSVMIYHSTFDGLSRTEQKQLSTLAVEYHKCGKRTSLFLTSYSDSLKGMNFDLTYNTGGTSSP